MLTPSEKVIAAQAAEDATRASDYLPVLRGYARLGRPEDLPELIDIFIDRCDVFKESHKYFMSHAVVPIIVNHYWPTVWDIKKYAKFVKWSSETVGWGDGIVESAASQDLFLKAIASVSTMVDDYSPSLKS